MDKTCETCTWHNFRYICHGHETDNTCDKWKQRDRTMVKTIKIWNNRKNCAEYLHRRYPAASFIDDIMYCLKLDDAEARSVSAGLTFRGIEHEVIEVEGNH